jgi:serine/threonine protein kinase/formylglycine-generating enzyme required for sulfatase activity
MNKRRSRGGSETPTVATIITASVDGERTPEPARARRVALPARYVDLELVGTGSFGEVRRVRDVSLDRALVLKILHEDYVDDAQARWRFSAEARVTAALQHPGIVPVYDHGELSDGRLWYAMKEVRGQTLGAILGDLHDGACSSGFAQTASGWTFRRVIEALARVAQTIAFAHARSVIHRDLKPENLMVGEFGEVLVMDWGLALDLREREDRSSDGPTASGVRAASAALTHAGDVLGTPAYMPREQAIGDRAAHGPHSDVYSLGAILFHVLTGVPPFAASSAREALAKLLSGRAPSAQQTALARGAPEPPDELRALCDKALREAPSERGTAEEFSTALVDWLDGANKRDRALAALELAREQEPEVEKLRQSALDASDAARARWSTLRAFDEIEKKRDAWALEDRAALARRDAALAEAQWLESVLAVRAVDPTLAETRDALAEYYRDRLVDAEQRGSIEDAARYEAMLRANDRGQHAAFLRGEGRLSLVTDPPDASVTVARAKLSDRRLVYEDARPLGRAPLREVTLEFGSYRLELRAPGCATIHYPVEITRDGQWISSPDNSEVPYPIALPRANELGSDDLWIAAGWAWVGGDPNATDSLPRERVWIDSFVIKRDPVTVGEYLQFCNDLAASGRVDDALAYRPTTALKSRSDGTESPFVLIESKKKSARSSRFTVVDDPLWAADVPVVSVTWHAAVAYARWYAKRTGLPWRLPDEYEREKAARGVDGRLFPWGSYGDATFACVAEGHRDEPRRTVIGLHPFDVSVYGVRGLAGNSHDWCANVWRRDGPSTREGRLVLEQADDADPDFRVIRGGAWNQPLNASRAASRFGARPELGRRSIGVRLARSRAPCA